MWRIFWLGHQRVGVLVYPLVLILASTGLLLSHSDSIGLGDKRVRFAPVLSWYGMEPEGEIVNFRAGAHWVTDIEQRLIVDGRDFAPARSPLRGAVEVGAVLVLATRDAIFLADAARSPALIDRLDGAVLPGAVERIGRSPSGRLALATEGGVFGADRQFLRFSEIDSRGIAWSETTPAPQAVRRAALRAYRGEGLPLSRVLLDLHSGRIFGRFGPWLMDAAAVMLLFLSLSGVLQRYRAHWLGRALRKG